MRVHDVRGSVVMIACSLLGLQAAQAGPAPVLIRIETKAGHGAGKSTSKLIEETADRWAFLTRVLKIDVPVVGVVGGTARSEGGR